MSKVVLKQSKTIWKYSNISSHEYYLFSKDLLFLSFFVLNIPVKTQYIKNKKVIIKNTGKNWITKFNNDHNQLNNGIQIQFANHESDNSTKLHEIFSIIFVFIIRNLYE